MVCKSTHYFLTNLTKCVFSDKFREKDNVFRYICQQFLLRHAICSLTQLRGRSYLMDFERVRVQILSGYVFV